MPEVDGRTHDGGDTTAVRATRPPVCRWAARTAAALLCALSLTLLSVAAPARADDDDEGEAPAEPAPTFAYTTAVEANYARALFELSGVFTIGFLWYVTQTDIVEDYDVNYSWDVFRKKLTGESIAFDTNHFGTNFIGHPLGGTAYYLAARSNRLSIGASFGVATGGSLLWEYFGEAREVVSLNDMIVTPLAGVAIGEPWTQLGAFFDRSRPSLGNRILGSFFGPLKSLNDSFDGAVLARSRKLDRYGFPADEGHEFNLGLGWAATFPDDGESGASHELRLGLGSRLARLPGYNDAGQHSLVFSDGNVSSITLAAAYEPGNGLVDLNFETDFTVVGYYFRNAAEIEGQLFGQDLVLALTAGYRHALHDYDRDHSGELDRISSVNPFGLLIEHRGLLGAFRTVLRIEASPSFAGVTPYALRLADDTAVELPDLIRGRKYYFGFGGRYGVTLRASLGLFEAEGTVRFEHQTQVDGARAARDQRLDVRARVGAGIPDTPLRVNAFVERRERRGEIEDVRAKAGELSGGLEIGARF